MEERLSRQEILRRLTLEHQRLVDTFARLTPEQWIAPNVVGTWTAKDVIAHLVFWNRFPVQELRAAAKGTSVIYPEGTGDEINARAVASFQGWTAETVRSAFEQSYAELLDCVKTLPDSAFEADSLFEQALGDTVEGALANNTYEHWPVHEAQIRTWIGHHF
ncbi:MAG: maleylpyruvate isomerase N-terminal domain-containing protein [Anaerolineae bacterium]|nr:maleylpyruvate isomerase N-terminal domain-containing protein [Anaerolineae bacterium]